MFTYVTLGTPPRWLQQNGAVLSNKGNLAQSQNTHQYVLPAILSVFLIHDLVSVAHVYSRSVLLTISAYSS